MHPCSSPRLAALTVVTVALFAITACGAGAAATGGTTPPSGSVGQTPAPDDATSGGPGPGDPAGSGAIKVKPEPGIRDARPHAWDHVDVAGDGKTLTVYYWGGVEDCYGLSEVKVGRDRDGALSITLLEGTRAAAVGKACIEIAVLKAVAVTLDEPLIVSDPT